MEQDTHAPIVDRGCPVGFVVVPTFVGALLWLVVLLSRYPG